MAAFVCIGREQRSGDILLACVFARWNRSGESNPDTVQTRRACLRTPTSSVVSVFAVSPAAVSVLIVSTERTARHLGFCSSSVVKTRSDVSFVRRGAGLRRAACLLRPRQSKGCEIEELTH